MRLAMIGLGRMGANISRRLMKDGHEIVAFDRDEAAIAALTADGATGADSYVGSWGTVDRQSPHLVIVADGTFTGSDGCNTLRGAWELEDDGSIEFDDVAMTRMACEGVDQTLNRLDSATVAGDDLTVYGDDVITLITLPRTG